MTPDPQRMLIVDGDPIFVDDARATLEAAGYAVDAAYNPKDGWRALKARPYDLVILDLLMGRGAEGVMLARKIRKEAALRETPVLIVTAMQAQIAFLFPRERLRTDLIPADALLEKPVKPPLLLETVAALLAAPPRRQAAGA